MKIGFDAKRAFFNHTGLGNYSRTLLNILLQHFPENDYHFYSPKTIEQAPYADFSKGNVSTYQLHTPQTPNEKRWNGSLWRSFRLGQQIATDELDIYHGLSHELPFDIAKSKAKKVVTIHDLIFMRYPQWYPFIDRFIYKKKWKHSCEKADKIIAISHQTKRDIVEFLKIDSDKIEVIYQSCNPIFYDYSDLMYLQHGILPSTYQHINYELPEEYILYVGSITVRKNLLNIIKALEQLKGKISVPLVVVGEGKAYKEKIKKYIAAKSLEKQVIFLKQVPNEHLPFLYRNASLMIYPSIFEGFGLPVVEALCSQTAVIAAKGSCLEEAGGPDSIYIDPHNVAELANAIEKVLTNDDLREKMCANGWQYAQQFRQVTLGIYMTNLYAELLAQK